MRAIYGLRDRQQPEAVTGISSKLPERSLPTRAFLFGRPTLLFCNRILFCVFSDTTAFVVQEKDYNEAQKQPEQQSSRRGISKRREWFQFLLLFLVTTRLVSLLETDYKLSQDRCPTVTTITYRMNTTQGRFKTLVANYDYIRQCKPLSNIQLRPSVTVKS